MKKIWRFLFAVSLIAVLAFPSNATSISEEETKKQELENELKNADDILEELKDKKSDAKEYIAKMDQELSYIELEIASLTAQIDEKNQEIKDAKKNLKKAQKEMKQQYADMKKRIQYLYEGGETKVIEMFFSSDSIAEFLNKAEYTNELASYDRMMLNEMKENSEKIERTKTKLEKDRESLKELKEKQSQQKKTVETLMESKASEVNIFNKQIAETQEEMKALKEEIAAQKAVIKEMKAIEEKRRKEAQERAQKGENVTTYNGGAFTWPAPGYTTITSGYAYRVDPITGEPNAYHNGIDIGAPYGSDIVAAYDGVVAWAYYSQTAGNFIGIDHGDGLYTVYMHCSKLLVSENQSVSAGETIGLVGSTGRSTGPHLHFGVRLNGEYVDPMGYLG